MAVLHLQPGRCLPADSFVRGSYAFVLTDRPVRLKGVLVTPKALYKVANDEGTMNFDLTPSADVDGGKEFSYTVAIYDDNNQRISTHNIVMPSNDSLLFDLVPEEFDLNSQEFVPTVCPIRNCGIDPRVIKATIETDFGLESSYLMLRHPDESEAIRIRNRFAENEEFTVLIDKDNTSDGLNFQLRRTPSYIYPASQTADIGDPYDHLLNTTGDLLRPDDLTVGNYIRMYFDGNTDLVVTEYNTTVGVPTQNQIDKFIACVVSGGVVEQPVLPEPSEPEEEIT